jgi:hypothetical protein
MKKYHAAKVREKEIDNIDNIDNIYNSADNTQN